MARDAQQTLRELEERLATLEQLLQVYERSVLEQSDRLYAEQERLRLQTTLLESQGEASLDGILSVSEDGTVLFANRRLGAMWGMATPVAGTKTAETVLQAMAARARSPQSCLARVADLTSDETHHDEIELNDGRFFDCYSAPIRTRAGEPLGRVLYFRDVTRSRELVRQKDDFVSAVSHELRTPLTSIRGALGLLASGMAGEIPAEASALVRIAHANCERLVRLVNDVLDIEKIEAGHMEFHLEEQGLSEIVKHAMEAVGPFGMQFGVEFTLRGSVPEVRVRVDRDRLIQVLENLLSNAAKFSPSGDTVDVTVEPLGEWVRVRVTDHGEGIPLEFRDQVFEKFAQGRNARTRQQGGTGLGLAISKAIVEGFGGRIGYQSELGVGTTFYFDLPVVA